MNITFEKASLEHKDLIFRWLSEPHMMEFWDNSQDHKDDILNFIHNRPQHRYSGTTKYWIGLINDIPYSFILSDVFKEAEDLSDIHKKHMSKSGNTIGIDFSIGNKKYLGQGLAVPTLDAFIRFYKSMVDIGADTFFIDPDENNPRAKHVYAKAGFLAVGEFEVKEGPFKGQINCLMVRNYE
jgi:RimJ/RimL family protein N-acetyltransferase